MKEWFENWFNSPYYEILYKNRNEAEAGLFIEHLIQYLKLSPGDKVADIPCGAGRHASFLAEKGLEVFGSDLASNSIDKAIKTYGNTIQWSVADMRVKFAITPRKVVFNLFTSLGYFDDPNDNLKCIENFYSILENNGYLIIDFFNAVKVKRDLIPSEIKNIDQIAFLIEKSIENNKVIKKIHFSDQGKEYHFEEKVFLYRPELIKEDLKKVGFQIMAEFGNYHLHPFDENVSDRYIVVAQKI